MGLLKPLGIFGILIGLVMASASCQGAAPSSAKAATAAPLTAIETIKCNYYDDKNFRRSVTHARGLDSSGLDVKGGITPHHLLADDLIATFFKQVSVAQPEIVVILAPNHNNIGTDSIHTCLSRWETPFGLLKTDTDLVGQLVRDQKAGLDSRLMAADHSISGLIPYVKYYMPQCQVVPILLHGEIPLDLCKDLGAYVAGLVKNKKAVILASVDFSHYLPLETADKMDQISIHAIEKRDLEQIHRFDNDNMDSPSTIITFLSAMNALKADHMRQLGHSNSDRIARQNAGNTTSYFTLLFG